MVQAVADNVAYYQTQHLVNHRLHILNCGLSSQRRWGAEIRNCKRILEVGCGNGKLCEQLAECFNVTGVDLVNGPYNRKGYAFQTLDIMEQELPTGFDAVLSFDVLEHIETAKVPFVLKSIGQAAPLVILSIAGYSVPPSHLTVKSPGWWLNALYGNMENRTWSVQIFNRYAHVQSPVYIFIGRIT